jgi:hypothetical protein
VTACLTGYIREIGNRIIPPLPTIPPTVTLMRILELLRSGIPELLFIS